MRSGRISIVNSKRPGPVRRCLPGFLLPDHGALGGALAAALGPEQQLAGSVFWGVACFSFVLNDLISVQFAKFILDADWGSLQLETSRVRSAAWRSEQRGALTPRPAAGSLWSYSRKGAKQKDQGTFCSLAMQFWTPSGQYTSFYPHLEASRTMSAVWPSGACQSLL